MTPMEFCAGLSCSNWLRDGRTLPLCRRCWQRLAPGPRAQIRALSGAGEHLAARTLAALVAELPARTLCADALELNRTWITVRANVAEALEREARDYQAAVEPWRVLLADLFRSIAGAAAWGRWSHVELACAMVRTRSGVDGYNPYLLAAAVDLDEQTAANAHAGAVP